MRRTIIVISLCFLLGVITSVIVAWWCALWDGGALAGYRIRGDTGEFQVAGWDGEIYSWAGLMTVHANEGQQFRPISALSAGTRIPMAPPSWVDFDHPPVLASDIDALAAGWPWHCLHYIRERDDDRWSVIQDWAFDEYGVLLGTNPLTDHSDRWLFVNRLPMRPLWMGLIANTGVYAAGWFAIALTGLPWRWFRSYRKRRRQLCLHCSHDQRFSTSSDVCAECGRDPRRRRPMFGVMSIGALSVAAIVLCGGTIVFAMKFASQSPYPRLHYAAYRGDVETVREELGRGADVEALYAHSIHGRQHPALAMAAMTGEAETVQVLIDAGVNVNTSADDGNTALMRAVDDVELVRFLLDNGADMTPANRALHTAVTLAGRQGTEESLRLLLQRGGNPEDLRNVELWEGDAKQRRAMIDRVLAELDNAKTGAATNEDDS